MVNKTFSMCSARKIAVFIDKNAKSVHFGKKLYRLLCPDVDAPKLETILFKQLIDWISATLSLYELLQS